MNTKRIGLNITCRSVKMEHEMKSVIILCVPLGDINMKGKITRQMHDAIKKTFNLSIVFPDYGDYGDFFNDDDSIFYDNSLSESSTVIHISDDDDFFNSTQIDHLLTPEPLLQRKSPLESTPKQTRFNSISSEKEILQRIKENVPLNTQYQTNWAASVWKQWAEWRNTTQDTTIPDNIAKMVPSDIKQLSEEELGFWLSRFVLEVKKKNGDDYPPNSLYQICCSIQRAYNDRSSGKFKAISIFDKNDERFYKFYESLDSRMRELTQKGLGVKVNQADFILPEEEGKLWEMKVINMETGQGLINGVYFYNTKCFSLRGGQIHRSLQKDQYKIDIDLETGTEVLKFYERLSKTAQCGLRGRKNKPRVAEIFAESNNDHCVVKLFKTYLSKIPDGPLYLKPSTMCPGTFTSKVIGKNMLGSMMQAMFKAAKIDTNGRKITGHSGRVTMCTTLFNNGFSESSVRKRSGHRSDAINLYMREKVNMRKRASSFLQAIETKKSKPNGNMLDSKPSSLEPCSSSTNLTIPLSPLESALNFIKDQGKGELKVNTDGSFSVSF